MASGQLPMASGHFPTTSGHFPMASGQLPMASGRFPTTAGDFANARKDAINYVSTNRNAPAIDVRRDAMHRVSANARWRHFIRKRCVWSFLICLSLAITFFFSRY
jgi:hypothetical protein